MKEKSKNIETQTDKLDNRPEIVFFGYKNTNPVDKSIQIEALKNNIQINIVFYISLIVCMYVLSMNDDYKPNYTKWLKLILLFIMISFLGYVSHVLSHNINLKKSWDKCDTILKDVSYVNRIMEYLIHIVESHHVTHHDTEINKEWKNILQEAINNIFIQGVFWKLVGEILNLITWEMCFIWGGLYTTLHLINYYYIEPKVHADHHKMEHTNYGIDIYDILMGTKYDWNDIEEYNHYSINIIILTLIVYSYRKWRENKKANTTNFIPY